MRIYEPMTERKVGHMLRGMERIPMLPFAAMVLLAGATVLLAFLGLLLAWGLLG